MKTLYTLLANLLLFGSALAQTYQPMLRENVTWDVQHILGTEICLLSGGNRYFIQGDSLVAGTTYKVVRTYPIVQVNPGPYCPPFAVDQSNVSVAALMREDVAAQKVYYLDITTASDALLYDFTLQAGDSITDQYATLGSTLAVDSVRILTLPNGSTRKVIHYGGNSQLYYLEGIGSTMGLFQHLMFGIGFGSALTCHQENNTQQFGYECFVVLARPESAAEAGYQVYPNPSLGQVYVTNPSASPAVFTVTDLTGRQVYRQTIHGLSSTLNLSKLPASLYVYSIVNTTGKHFTGKLLLAE